MQEGIPAPPSFDAGLSPEGLLAGWLVLAAAAVGIAIWLAVRNRDVLPVAACAGAFICTLNEPIFDVLAELSYADDLDVAYSAFGRDIPWTLVVGYVPWVGLVPYLLFRLMASGARRSLLHLIAAGLIASVALVEVVNAVWLEAWKYYGESSWRGVLGGGIVQMAAMPLLLGLLYYVFAASATGWRRALAGLVFPAVALPMLFAATTWPLYFSNHTDLPAGVDWAAAAVAVALSLGAIPAITSVASRWREPGPAPRLNGAQALGEPVGDASAPPSITIQ